MNKSNSKRIFMSGLFVIIAFAILFGEADAQTTITLRQCSDNTIYEESSSYSNGSGDYFFAGTTVTANKRRGLINFFILSKFIPPCATIQNVTLRLHMSRTISGPKNVQLHRLLQDWGESGSDAPGEEGFGTQADPGDATWVNNYYPDDNWVRPGGYFEDSASAATSVDQNGYYYWSSPKMAQDVQGWIRTQTNFGWILIGDESAGTTAKRFDTRENPDTSYRPLISVTYTLNSLPLNVGVLIEGFFNGSTQVPDTVKVLLRSPVSPYAVVDSAQTLADAYGNALVCFPNADTGNYYVVVKHRNSIETWSAAPVALSDPFFNYYDFTSSASLAYGNNLTFVYPSFCIYSGDVNQDGTVDGTDLQLIDNDSYAFVSGYVPTDVNGDDFVDGTDASIAGNNANNFVSVIRP